MTEKNDNGAEVVSSPLLDELVDMIISFDHEADDLRKSGRERERRIYCEGVAGGIAWCLRKFKASNPTGQATATAKETP